MLRLTKQCVLLLVLASCGGFIVNSNIGHDDRSPDIADILENPKLKNIRLEPVSLSALKQQLQNTKSYYDFFRIFLTNKDVTNDLIDEIVNARTIQNILGHANKKRRDYDYDFEEYDYDDMPSDAEQERQDEELADAWHHVEEMAESPLGECKTPQPEIVNVMDNDNRNKIYLPECTVVHRCRNTSGCCGSTRRECGPLKVQVIERSFLVLDRSTNDKILPGQDMVEKKYFENHTECGCKEKEGLPSCDSYKCPFPFTMKRKGINCSCDCEKFSNENNFLCEGIKDGLLPLTETDLECIKKGKCLPPDCTRGKLHIQSGHCPTVQTGHIHPFESQIHQPEAPQIHPVEPRLHPQELAQSNGPGTEIRPLELSSTHPLEPQVHPSDSPLVHPLEPQIRPQVPPKTHEVKVKKPKSKTRHVPHSKDKRRTHKTNKHSKEDKKHRTHA